MWGRQGNAGMSPSLEACFVQGCPSPSPAPWQVLVPGQWVLVLAAQKRKQEAVPPRICSGLHTQGHSSGSGSLETLSLHWGAWAAALCSVLAKPAGDQSPSCRGG